MRAIETTSPAAIVASVRGLDAAVDVVVGIALVGELAVIIGNVLGRMFFNEPLLWSDEAAGCALSIMAFLGGAIAYRRDAHVRVRTVDRESGVRDFFAMVAQAATASGMVLFTLAAAQAFSWVLSAAELPHRLAETVTTWASGPFLFLLVSVIALIVLGSLLEGLPAILILVPLLVPLAPQAGVDPLHYGIVLLVAMGIGAFLPPLGVGFCIACSVVRGHADRATRAMIPYFVVLLIGVMVVAYVPWFTLYLPPALGMIR